MGRKLHAVSTFYNVNQEIKIKNMHARLFGASLAMGTALLIITHSTTGMVYCIARMTHQTCIVSKLCCWHKLLNLKILPKLLMFKYGTKRQKGYPNQAQGACQQDISHIIKVKYQCKFCEMLWLAKLALFSQILAIFSTFLALKHFYK